MVIHLNKAIAGAFLALTLSTQLTTPALAYWNQYNPYYNSYNTPYNYNAPRYNPYSVFTSHPILSGLVVGSAVGAAGGAAVGAVQNHKDVRDQSSVSTGTTQSKVGSDAAVGAGTGAVLGTVVGIYRNVQIHRYGY